MSDESVIHIENDGSTLRWGPRPGSTKPVSNFRLSALPSNIHFKLVAGSKEVYVQTPQGPVSVTSQPTLPAFGVNQINVNVGGSSAGPWHGGYVDVRQGQVRSDQVDNSRFITSSAFF